jgi:hypothetical protein
LTVEADKRKAERLEKLQAEHKKLQRKVFRLLSLDCLSSYLFELFSLCIFNYRFYDGIWMFEYKLSALNI